MFPTIDNPKKEIWNKENIDLRSFPFKTEYWPSLGTVPEVVEWCRKHIGPKSVQWTHVLYRIQSSNTISYTFGWRFKHKEDLTLFKMRWL